MNTVLDKHIFNNNNIERPNEHIVNDRQSESNSR